MTLVLDEIDANPKQVLAHPVLLLGLLMSRLSLISLESLLSLTPLTRALQALQMMMLKATAGPVPLLLAMRITL